MGNAKREALALIQQLPDNSSLEDIQYHLYIREKVEHGLRDLKSKQTLSQKEVERRTGDMLAALEALIPGEAGRHYVQYPEI